MNRLAASVCFLLLFSQSEAQQIPLPRPLPASSPSDTPDWVIGDLNSASNYRAVPHLLKYKGVLMDAKGRPRAGVIGMTFSLYAENVGGAPLWIETQNAELDEYGRYTVLLGATRSDGLPPELFATGEARWLEVQPQGEEEQPRVQLVSVPYALKAEETEKLSGKVLSDLVLVEGLREAVREEVEALSKSGSTGSSSIVLPGYASFEYLSTRTLNNIRLVDRFPGDTAGEKIAACIADLPSSGGTCDARGLIGVQFINGLTINKTVTLLFGSGYYIVTDSILITNVHGVEILGSGSFIGDGTGTQFRWKGTKNAPVFRLEDVNRSRFANFKVTAHPAEGTRTVAFRLENGPGRKVPPRERLFENIVVSGVIDGITTGFQYVVTEGGTDENNDFDTFIHVQVHGYTIAGWSFEHSQSKGHRLYSCHFTGGKYGVTTALAPGGFGGSFLWYAGGGGNNSVADFYLGAMNDAILISGGSFELSARLLETAGNSQNAWAVYIQGVRWASLGLHPDNRAIVYTHRGPITLIGNLIRAQLDRPLSIYIAAIGPSYGVAIGNQVISTLPNPFTGNQYAHWNLIGNALNWGPSSLLPNSLDGVALSTTDVGAPASPCMTGSLYTRKDGGAGSTLYVCEAGSWAPK